MFCKTAGYICGLNPWKSIQVGIVGNESGKIGEGEPMDVGGGESPSGGSDINERRDLEGTIKGLPAGKGVVEKYTD